MDDNKRNFNRSIWIDPKKTPVSNDLRRVPVFPEPKGPEGTIVLRDGRIFDGSGTPARRGTLVIERNKIKDILPPNTGQYPKSALVINAADKTIMPGLIEMHTHLCTFEPGVPERLYWNQADAVLRGVERLRYWIECGITSVRDNCSAGDAPFRLKEWVARNRIAGPRIFPVGQGITATGGHGAEGYEEDELINSEICIADGPEGWRKAVRKQFNRGADWIKTLSHFSSSEIAAAVDEAHDLGLRVTADAETFYIHRAVEAGVDCVEHPLPRTDETIKLMAEKKTYAIPTLIPYIYIFNIAGNYSGTPSRRFTFNMEDNLEMLSRMKSAGVKMGIGTDLTFDWFRHLPDAYITEMKQFLKVGFSVPEVLSIATKTNAEILGMDDKLGTLGAGKLADVIVIEGKPDKNIDDIAKIDLVIRDGHIVVKEGRIFTPRHTPRKGTPKGWID
ncbi:MAG: amidohydrolase family protein [Candidatus Aminicenantes bacterium]|nr:amidohydrolase family protein [Candidatus Aminicenantes bacterium]